MLTFEKIPVDDVALITDRLKQALLDDALVDRASELNWDTVRERLDQSKLKQKAISLYNDIFQTMSTM